MLTITRWIPVLLIASALGGAVVPAALAETEATTLGGWQVLEKHGRVRYRPAGELYWWTARTGTEIPGGSSVAADGNGFLIIARAGESITMRSNGRLELPGGQRSDVQQTAGDLRYRITRAPDRRFAVETPYLSLLVKGTVFDVAVDHAGAEVEVEAGRVQVDTPGGQVVELTPGHAARIAAREHASIEVRAGPEFAFAPAPPNRSRASIAGPAPVAAQTRKASFSEATATSEETVKADRPRGNRKGHHSNRSGKGRGGGGNGNGNGGGNGNGNSGNGNGNSGNGNNGNGNGGGNGGGNGNGNGKGNGGGNGKGNNGKGKGNGGPNNR